MINFFRKTRKRLAEDNKPMKYLRYALGEILLVVIGILIALSINNWNEERKKVKQEYYVLMNLVEDFKTSLANLEKSTNEDYLNWSETLQTTRKYFGLNDVQLTDAMRDTIRSTGYVYTDIIEGSLNSILSSEKLELIRNENLKNKLTAYPAHLKRFKKFEKNLEDYVLNIQRDIFRQHVSLLDDAPNENPLKQRIAKSDYEGLMNNRYYQNVVIGQKIVLSQLINTAELLNNRTVEIYTILLEELKQNPNYNKN